MAAVMRPYQQTIVAQVRAAWERVDRVIAVSPTGSGKTVLAGELAAPFLEQHGADSVLSVCHTRSLCEQLSERLCQAATWQGLRIRQQQGKGWPTARPPKLLVVDEVHVGDSPDWQQVFQMIEPGTKVLGLTATPWRFSHGVRLAFDAQKKELQVGGKKNAKHGLGLGDLFQAMIVGVTPRELVKNGYLVPVRVLNIVEAQDAAAARRGEHGPSWDPKKQRNTGRVMASSDERLCPVDAWMKYGENRKTMVFSHMIPAAERACAKFQALGVSASVVHGKLGAKECRARLDAFKRNETKVLVNVMQLTAGVDVPDVSCLVLDRGANNLNTYIQICGRGARLAPGKTDCLVLDLTGCSSVHGDPQKDQDYWVVTSEGRQSSNLQCEVCGTRLSPMFPSRCMKCDPFRPKLGDPKELLDTGMRVYCLLKDLRDSEGWIDKSADAQDRLMVAALAQFTADTEIEGQTRDEEIAALRTRIADREQEREQERVWEADRQRRAEETERSRLAWEESQRKMAEARAAMRQQMEERIAADRAKAQEALKQRAASFADRYRQREQKTDKSAEQELLEQGLAPWEPADLKAARHALVAKFRLYIQRGWSLSSAVRDVRQSLPRYASRFAREDYRVPACLLPVLVQLNGAWCRETASLPGGGGGYDRSLAQYELERMMGDARISKYGEAWCRKKVRELFGHDCFAVSAATAERALTT